MSKNYKYLHLINYNVKSCLFKSRTLYLCTFSHGNYKVDVIFRANNFDVCQKSYFNIMFKNTGKYVSDKPTQKEESSETRIRAALENDRIDAKYGFERYKDTKERTGFLLNMHSAEILDDDKRLVSAMDYYFIEMDGSRFKISLAFQPYFLINARKECQQEVVLFLSKKFAGTIYKIEVLEKEDLDLANHLSGLKQTYIKLSFASNNDMQKVRREILTAVNKNKEREKTDKIYAEMLTNTFTASAAIEQAKKTTDHMENILDIREHDVPYHVRVSIDKKICCGTWYTVKVRGSDPPIITKRDDLLERPDPIVLAFDIETTKLPLKFPDSQTDQIMMISYMIDGQGYLITNREIISTDVEDFEYSPKPEFEGLFTIFNEPDEKCLLQKFFDHILDVKPHIFVTYNGDFFDWPFVETRAEIHGLDMMREIGFSKQNSREGAYQCRPAMHMDCLCWVKRDSYLPVGSQGLKAVAKAKLRYDPVELDPEDMCKMAVEQPQVLSNYSVSDAVATYYLYMKYVHPFIFALCTIIPQEPDEVLRKGSGTLCESLLMVEAFHANIVFPNKQIEELNKLTPDGHLLEQETYVGGHVEALESGVFRSDIPCRFKLVPEAFDKLIESTKKVLSHAIEVEENVPLDMVTNFDEVCNEIIENLTSLREHPNRLENPVIYHLDVGAMYPNIILTNRLQPSAMVNSSICAVCDHNKPGSICQRSMEWTWRGDMLPAHRSEYQRIQQQLETEKFPSLHPGGQPRPFHALPKEDQAAYEKKRLSDYCRKAYKKVKITKEEIRTTTVCQKENSFYVDTVRAFRDRRYEYKALNKQAKQKVAEALAGGDAGEIKLAKSCEVLYDSLQLAHKCILNSFYGYVMRRGARWHSMEMAGIVCYTGAQIIMRAREIIEQVGRPLELDTDGIWCILPASFPQNFTVLSNHPKKKKLKISYPNAVLNSMVKDFFTNEQYHEFNSSDKTYTVRCENSIFFEVDGPYLGMILPASKEEGKRLKKRYAVFNFDGTLAELKGFEVKRRGELQLIKIFQSSVFDAFLKGDSLETCYASVAKIADYWLDVLYSKGCNMPDSELFELISENRSMSKKLEDYGSQKSTSISTAKRLAEFLGDQMVKDAGLACKYIISRKPEGAPVTERAIPLAIFQTGASIKRHHLRRWLKDNSISDDIDIRDVLDWSYYIERLSGAIQKIITIPAAMQGLSNPVSRVKHPDWLHKKMLEKNDVFKQRKISDIFSFKSKDTENIDTTNNTENTEEMQEKDMEDLMNPENITKGIIKPVVTVKRKRKPSSEEDDLLKFSTWKEALGPPPPFGKTKTERVAWITFQKKKWAWQAAKRGYTDKRKKGKRSSLNNENGDNDEFIAPTRSSGPAATLGDFLKRAHRTLLDTPWQIIQISETAEPGLFKLWALVGSELRQIKLTIPRVFYVNQRVARPEDQGSLWKRCKKILPRGRPVLHLYQYTVPEELYRRHQEELMAELSAPEIEGIYETQMSLEFRALVQLGCICTVDRQEARKLVSKGFTNMDNFSLHQLQFKSIAYQQYLPKINGVSPVKQIFLYHHVGTSSSRAMWALCLGPTKKMHIFVLDTVRTNQMPNMNSLYNSERSAKMSSGTEEQALPPSSMNFEVKCEVDIKQVYKLIQRALQDYREEHKGPTLCAVQSGLSLQALQALMPGLGEFPLVPIHVRDVETLYNSLDWQRLGARAIVRHYLNLESVIDVTMEQCRYFHVPIGNMPADPTLFGADLFFARHLVKYGFVLWCSNTDRPDLGGRETDDNRLVSEIEELGSNTQSNSGTFPSVCVELEMDALAVCALMQASQILQTEGTSSATSFESSNKAIQDAFAANASLNYDEAAQCSVSFRILRTMVGTWLRDVSTFKNVFADFQISHFYRWLRTPTCLLYDPALRRTLHNLMKKLFLQLVAEFKRLGSQIVLANFNRIILWTKKTSISDAIGYVEFVVQSIRNKELFHGIEISYKQCWSYLLWLDSANYAGIKGKLPKGLTEVGESQMSENNMEMEINEDEQESDDAIEMNWNLMEYLPAQVREHFAIAVAGYVSAAFSEPDNLPSLLRGQMSQKLFQITERIYSKIPSIPYENDGTLMSVHYDSKKSVRNPALEFINAICKIFGLDTAMEHHVNLLRQNLLQLIGVGEFSEEATWKDPCTSFILHEIICKVCNHCRDLDMCKDNHRNIENDRPVCLCPVCGTSYDNSELEWRIIEALNKKTMAYTLQDLICVRCHQVKRENLSTFCNCAGDFRELVSKKDLISTLKTFRVIADYFEMPILSEVVTFNLQL